MKTLILTSLCVPPNRSHRKQGQKSFFFRQLISKDLKEKKIINHQKLTSFKMQKVKEKLHFVASFTSIVQKVVLSMKENLITACGDCLFFNNSQLNFLST
jgi:hypothetical protein